jgi:hypothetical protein
MYKGEDYEFDHQSENYLVSCLEQGLAESQTLQVHTGHSSNERMRKQQQKIFAQFGGQKKKKSLIRVKEIFSDF